MKRRGTAIVWASLLGLVAANSSALAQSVVPPQANTQSDDRRWETIFNSEVRYFSWTSSQAYPPGPLAPQTRSQGQQVFNPFGLKVVGKPTDDWKIETLVRGGYVWSRQESGGVVGEYSGFTDTTVGGTATYNGFNGLQPFASVNVNMPTGQTVFRSNATFSKQDSDIVGIPSFGEGWNIGPTVGVNVPLNTSTVFSTGAGYTVRGPFDREGLIVGPMQLLQRFDPGDVFTANASIAYRGDRLSLSASISYSIESTTTLNDIAYYKSGDRVFAAAGIGYAWTDQWASRLTGSFSHFARNKILNAFGMPPLVLEAFNTNSDVATVNFDTIYTQGSFSIGPTVGYLFRDHNGYSPISFSFLPAKTKWSAGVVSKYAVSEQASFNLRVERMWLHEDAHPFFFPDVGTDAWLVTLGGILKF